MYKSIAKTVSLALCVCLTAGAVCCALRSAPVYEAAAERTIETVDEEIKACEALISRLNGELDALRQEIGSVEGESAAASEQAQFLAAEVAVLETQIELNESLLLSCDMKRATAQTELLLVQNEYDYYNALFLELMRFIYENGTTNDFELLFSSVSLQDYLSRRDNFNSIMECVDDLRVSMERSLLRLTELEETYAAACAQYASHLETLEANKKTLADSQAELEKLADRLGLEGDALSGKYAELSENITEAKERLSALRAEREELYNIMIENEQKPAAKPSDLGFTWPLGDSVSYRVAKQFETSEDGTVLHEGLDVLCAKSSPILAAAAGVVTKAAWYGGYGNCVIIYHGQDADGKAITTLYGHAGALRCVEGQPVKQGAIVALVGATGRAETNHLHFSVLQDGVFVDPGAYLPDGYYTKSPSIG